MVFQRMKRAAFPLMISLVCACVVYGIMVTQAGSLLSGNELSAYTTAKADLDDALDRGDVVRLHIIAASDSAKDQALKLEVRDAILDAYASILTALNPSDARDAIRSNLNGIRVVASDTVERAIGDDPMPDITVTFTRETFPDREYAGMVVPAGSYDSLVVRIGNAQGRNWWCVIYPPLCLMTPDTIEAMEAARPNRPDAIAEAAPLTIRSPPSLPHNVSDIINTPRGRLASYQKPKVETPPPVFHSSVLQWLRSLVSII